MIRVISLKFLRRCLWAVCFMLFIWLNGTSSLKAQTNPSEAIVRVVILYDETCVNECRDFLSNTIPQLERQYGQQLQVISIDISLARNQQVRAELSKLYDLPSETVSYPVMIAGQSIVTGLSSILQEITTLLDITLQAGGNPFPNPVITWLFQQMEDAQNNIEALESDVEALEAKVVGLENSLRTHQLFLVGLAILLLLLLSGIGLLFQLRRQTQQELKESQIALNVAERERQRIINALIGNTHNSGPDYLGGLVRVHYEYQETGKVSPKAIRLTQELLRTMAYDFHLKPVAPYATKVPFDANLHRSYEKHKNNEMVWVIETGWQQEGKLLKPALVQNEFEVL